MNQIRSKVLKNDGLIRSKTNENGVQLDRKLRRKLIQNGKILCKILKMCLN